MTIVLSPVTHLPADRGEPVGPNGTSARLWGLYEVTPEEYKAPIEVTTTAAPRGEAWTDEPVAEAEAWRTRTATRRTSRIRAAEEAADGGTVVTTVRVPRRA